MIYPAASEMEFEEEQVLEKEIFRPKFIEDQIKASNEPSITELRMELYLLKTKIEKLAIENAELRNSLRRRADESVLIRDFETLLAEKERVLRSNEQLKTEKGHLVESVLELSSELDSLQQERGDDHARFQHELSKFADADRKARIAKHKLGTQIIDILKSRGVDSRVFQEVQMVVATATSSAALPPRPPQQESIDQQMQGSANASNRVAAGALSAPRNNPIPKPLQTAAGVSVGPSSQGGSSIKSQTDTRIVDSRIDPRVDSRIDPRVDPRIDPRVDPRIDPRLETREQYENNHRLDAEALRRLDSSSSGDPSNNNNSKQQQPAAGVGSLRSGRSGKRSIRSGGGRRSKKEVLDRDETDSIISSVSTHRSGLSHKVQQGSRKGRANPKHGAMITAENLAILNRLNGDRSGGGAVGDAGGGGGDDDEIEIQRTKQSDQLHNNGASWWPNLFV